MIPMDALIEALRSPLWLTFKTVLIAGLGFGILGIPIAFVCARCPNVLTRIVLFMVTLPLIFPPIAFGYLLMLLLGQQGMVGKLIFELFSVRILFSETGVYLAAWLAGLPLVVRPVKEALESVRLRELEACAQVMGLTRLQRFITVTLPLVKNTILAALLLGLARATGEVGMTLMLGGNVAGKTATLSLEIYNAVSRGDFELASLLCGILAVSVLGLYWLLEWLRAKRDEESDG